MRIGSNGFAYSETKRPLRDLMRWLQAGLDSLAYRLAHLRLPRPALICAAATLFYLG